MTLMLGIKILAISKITVTSCKIKAKNMALRTPIFENKKPPPTFPIKQAMANVEPIVPIKVVLI